MYITKTKTMPNGAVAETHTVDSINITPNYTVIVVTSRSSRDGPISWQESMTVDYDDIATDPLVAVVTLLTSAKGYLEGGTQHANPSEIEALRTQLISRVEAIRDKMIAGTAVTNYGVVDTDEVSIRNILGTYSAATASLLAGLPFSIKWRMHDNSLVDLDALKMLDMGNTVLKHVDFCYNRSWKLKELINDVDATVESLNAIKLNEGWNDTTTDEGETTNPTTTD